MSEEVYTPDECAKRCRISRAGLYNAWAASRGPRYFKHGTRRRITETAVREWLKQLEDETQARLTAPEEGIGHACYA
jgi:excisionase family DNA binding protein